MLCVGVHCLIGSIYGDEVLSIGAGARSISSFKDLRGVLSGVYL